MKTIRYDIENPGILPEGFTPSHVSGSWAYATIDERDPVFNNVNYIDVDQYEYETEPQRIFQEAVADGFDTELGYKLAMQDRDRAQVVQLLVLYRESGAPDSTELQIADVDGQLHTVTLAQFRQLAIGLGQAYAILWEAYRSAVS